MSGLTIEDFKDVFDNPIFNIPVRYDGKNYLETLSNIYTTYYAALSSLFYHNDSLRDIAPYVRRICDEIIESIKLYLNGKPSEAYQRFKKLFSGILMENQFTIYNTFYDPAILQTKSRQGRSKLFRARNVFENRVFDRSEIFHTPFKFRNKVATSRFSIAGYPSLYLSTSLELCLEELEYDLKPGRYICSRFELANENSARIIEVGIKPTDFWGIKNSERSKRQQLISNNMLLNEDTLKNYYYWFPLIIACSFIRIDRKDPFAVEYIVPQLLMEAVRNYKTDGVFMGIRYFSCASEYSSELGFNYVFPTNFDGYSSEYCPILSKSFLVSKPLFLNEYKNIANCETALRNAQTDYIF